tara:strand:- start:55 stop:516 length:462 start_codon:yes stop_codon:yes gene_type:complete
MNEKQTDTDEMGGLYFSRDTLNLGKTPISGHGYAVKLYTLPTGLLGADLIDIGVEGQLDSPQVDPEAKLIRHYDGVGYFLADVIGDLIELQNADLIDRMTNEWVSDDDITDHKNHLVRIIHEDLVGSPSLEAGVRVENKSPSEYATLPIDQGD